MANTQAMTTSFMGELMTATHNFGTAPVRASGATDSFKAALFLASATQNASTTAYGTSGEVTGTGYSAGGVAVTFGTPPTATNSSVTAGVAFVTPSASITYTGVTLATAFGSQTITAGTFTLTMPANTTSTALIRLATT